jgi:hypothetical protein
MFERSLTNTTMSDKSNHSKRNFKEGCSLRYRLRMSREIIWTVLTLLIIAAITWPRPASDEATPAGDTQSDTAVPQGMIEAPHAVLRTPADIEKDRDIVPQGSQPREVPNPTTIPQDEYLKAKQGSAHGTPSNDKDGPAQK